MVHVSLKEASFEFYAVFTHTKNASLIFLYKMVQKRQSHQKSNQGRGCSIRLRSFQWIRFTYVLRVERFSWYSQSSSHRPTLREKVGVQCVCGNCNLSSKKQIINEEKGSKSKRTGLFQSFWSMFISLTHSTGPYVWWLILQWITLSTLLMMAHKAETAVQGWSDRWRMKFWHPLSLSSSSSSSSSSSINTTVT